MSCVAVLGVPGREVYYLYMASIVGKRQGNATYYYLVESARVDGKPRIVSQQYLGSAAEVMAKLACGGPGEPVRVQYRSFGDLVLQSRLRKVSTGPVMALTGPVLVAAAPF